MVLTIDRKRRLVAEIDVLGFEARPKHRSSFALIQARRPLPSARAVPNERKGAKHVWNTGVDVGEDGTSAPPDLRSTPAFLRLLELSLGDAGMSRWAMTAMQVPPESDTSQSGNKRGEDYGRSAAQEPFKSALSYRNHLRSGVWHACIGGLNFRPLFRVLFRALAGVDFCRMQTLYNRPFGSPPASARRRVLEAPH